MIQLGVDYLRLSKEDEREGESGSISNQRKIIQQYCKQHGITLVKEFVDDDYSGGNFNRPGFRSMIDFLKENPKIAVVITKDLSRLGRDMSESSYYAERYFPEQNIRYLAIDDSFDSEKENMLAPFQFAMNDMYIRDASKKVKNALHIMMDKGEYCCRAPYGYVKDKNDIHHLIPDAETAPVVRDIFDMASSGASVGAIAKHLTDQGIYPPLKYRVETVEGVKSGNSRLMSDSWNTETIRRILKNPVYLGHTALGRSKKVSPKSDIKRIVPVEEWRVTENTHEPLVDSETFDLAASNLGKRSLDYRQYDHVRRSIFGGIAYCATCGASMCSSGTVYNGEREKYWFLTCQNIPARSRHKCPNGARIRYDALVNVVTEDLRAVLAMMPEERKAIVERAVERDGAKSGLKEEESRIASAKARLDAVEQIITKLYEDMYTDVVPRERALSMIARYDEEQAALRDTIQSAGEAAAKLKDTRALYERFFQLVDRVTSVEKLDRELLLLFVDRIEIGPKRYADGLQHGARTKIPFEQEVKIFYRFIGEDSFADQ